MGEDLLWERRGGGLTIYSWVCDVCGYEYGDYRVRGMAPVWVACPACGVRGRFSRARRVWTMTIRRFIDKPPRPPVRRSIADVVVEMKK